MPGIYGPPPPRPAKVAPAPDPPARPEHATLTALRWLGTFTILGLALYVWYLAERDKGSEQLDRLRDIQLRIDHLSRQPMPRLDIVPPRIQPLQTAEIIPNSAIIPATAPAPRQSATLISPR